jgi:hypothetical protein
MDHGDSERTDLQVEMNTHVRRTAAPYVVMFEFFFRLPYGQLIAMILFARL